MDKEELECDFLVLGAGLAGTMMARLLSDHHPDKTLIVVDKRPSPDTKNHWALLRFRDLETARALGVGVEEMEIEKAIYWRGKLHYEADLAMNNTYSLKTYGQIGNRSLKHLGIAKRYLPLTTPKPKSCLWGKQLTHIEPGEVFLAEDDLVIRIKYSVCISTIPMDALLQATRIGNSDVPFFLSPNELMSESIGIFRKQLKGVRCDVNQTIYFPETRFRVYRATLEKGLFIIEYSESDPDEIMEELKEVIGCFGIPFDRSLFDEIKPTDFHTQQNGKTLAIDDGTRRAIIYSLTDAYSLYSVGRFATWRSIRADQLVKDVYKVERMIRQGLDRTRYDRRLGERS